jgi:hypothetical protein
MSWFIKQKTMAAWDKVEIGPSCRNPRDPALARSCSSGLPGRGH